MKIYLSKYWRQSSILSFCVIIFSVAGLIAFCIWSNDKEDYIMVLCVAVYVLMLGGILLGSKRFLTYAIIEKNQIHSYSFFSKKLCVISTEKPVYYAIFSTPQGGRIAKFIVISNELFEYRDTYGFAKVRFIQHYDMAKQVVLPYNDQVIRLLDFDDWQRIC